MIKYGYKGTNNDHSTCEVCGREDLRKVMWLIELDPDGNELGEVFATGTTCGAKLLGYSQKDFNKAIKSAIESLRRAKNYAIQDHPLTRQADKKKREMRQAGMSTREIRHSPEFQQWRQMHKQARQEIENQSFVVEI